MIELEKEVDDEDRSNYEEEQHFKWDKLFIKLGIKIDPIRDILKNSHAKVVNTSTIDIDNIGYIYHARSSATGEVRAKLLAGKQKFKTALVI